MNRAFKMIREIATGALLVNIVWWLASVILHLNALPGPVAVYSRLGGIIRESMGIHILASLERIAAGVGIAVALGVGTGLLMNRFKVADRLLGSFIYFTYPVPKLALLPVVMLLAGIGEATKIILIVLIIVFQIIIATRDAAAHIPKENYQILTTLGASPWQILRKVTLPAILPDLFTTLRIAVGTAVSILFVTETYGTEQGMGYYIVDAWMRFNYTDMYAGIVILSLIGFMLFLIIDLSDLLLCRWKNKPS